MIAALLIYVIVERLLELVIARRNTQRLLAQDAVEVGAGHYPVMMAMHTAWLLSIIAWVIVKNPAPNVPLLALYAVLQIFRFWIMASLGRYWTTRIITVPGVPLVYSGPYRFVRHPNYVLVVAEIVVLPVAVGAVYIAMIFTVANAAMLCVRIRAEEKALKAREIS